MFCALDGGLFHYGRYFEQRGEFESVTRLTYLASLHLSFHIAQKTGILFYEELGLDRLLQIVYALTTSKQVRMGMCGLPLVSTRLLG